MKPKFAALQTIEHDHILTPETDGAFLHALQLGLLLALHELGHLSDTQLRLAEELLERGGNGL